MYKPVRTAVLLALLFCASTTFFAQAVKEGVVSINGGTRALFLKPPKQMVSPPDSPPADVVTIFTTLDKGKNAYNAISGVGIVGVNAGMPLPQWVAVAFIPSADHLVQGIQVGATYVTGNNELGLLLADDDNGIPGDTLHAWYLSNLPEFGSCCLLQTRKDATGVPVKAGKQYWVVLRTMPRGTNTYGVWNDNYQGVQGTWANNTGQGWHSSFQVLPAVGVYGK